MGSLEELVERFVPQGGVLHSWLAAIRKWWWSGVDAALGRVSLRLAIERQWAHTFHRKLNLAQPCTFNEKLQWLKLYWRDPVAVVCADKLAVRKFVADRVGAQYLTELYGVYEHPEHINYAALPDAFVLKTTHGSGMNLFCREKSAFDRGRAEKQLRRWLRTNYGRCNQEWVYEAIRPRIVAEEYLSDGVNLSLRDYKCFGFDGEVRLVQVDIDRHENHRRNFYDLDWNLLPLQIKFPREPGLRLQRPPRLAEMVALGRELSRGFPHVRVDLYYVPDRIYFGELTFFHGGGFERFNSDYYATLMGTWITLPQRGGAA